MDKHDPEKKIESSRTKRMFVYYRSYIIIRLLYMLY